MSFMHRGEPLDGAEAHELYSMFLAHVCSSEFHPRHPLITGAEKLAAMLDEYHARFNEVLSDDDDPLAERPRGEPSGKAVSVALDTFWDASDTMDLDDAMTYALDNAYAIDNPSREGPRCTCERGANLDHWSRCDVHRVERSYTAPLTPSDTEGEDG